MNQIVICGNHEVIASGGIDVPDERKEFDPWHDAVGEAWYAGASKVAEEIGDSNVDCRFASYNGGKRYCHGLVEVDLEVEPWHLWRGSMAQPIIDAVLAGGQAEVYREAAGGARGYAENLCYALEDCDEVDDDPARWTALAEKWEAEADAIKIDMDAAKAAWAEIEAQYPEDEDEDEEDEDEDSAHAE